MALLALLAPSIARAGVGIAPVRLQFDDALRGGTFAQTMLLSNEPSDGEAEVLEFTVTAKGETAPWVSFGVEGDPAAVSSFRVAKSERVVVRVSVTVPSDAANKKYEGTVFVEAKDAAASTVPGTVGVGTAAEIALIVNVNGVERREASIQDYVIDPAEVGQAQRFTAKIQNSGNVSVSSQLDVTIARGANEVQTLSSKGQNFPVFPGEDGSVHVEWPTAEQAAGEYSALFTVSDVSGNSPKVLGTKTVSFRLEPRGTLTRSGEFREFKLKNTPELGGVAIVEAVFVNSGSIATQAVFDGEVYLDGKLVKTAQSLARTVRAGETGPIGVNVDVTIPGAYKVVGKINFDGELTPAKEVAFTVAATASAGATGSGAGSDVAAAPGATSTAKDGSQTALIAGGGIGALAIAGGAVAVMGRRRKTRTGFERVVRP